MPVAALIGTLEAAGYEGWYEDETIARIPRDGGGCLDLRVWDLTDTKRQALIHATRWAGAASWVRDKEHGGFGGALEIKEHAAVREAVDRT